MAEDHHLSHGKPATHPRGTAVALAAVMHDGQMNAFPIELDSLRQGQLAIVVAEYGDQRGDVPQVLEHAFGYDVASVNDGIHPLEILIGFGRKRFRPFGYMRIR